MISELIFGLVAILIENSTGVVIVRRSNGENEEDEETGLIQVGVQEKLKEFTKFDPNDAIFREYDPPADQETDPKAWKKNIPSLKHSIFKSFTFVFIIQTVCGTVIGLLATFVVFIDFNTSIVCISQQGDFSKLPKTIRSIEILGHSVEGFIIELYNYFLLSTVFSWSQLKHLNLPLFNILVAFTDIIYELTLAVFELFGGISWLNYPLYALFTSAAIINGLILARHFRPRPHKWRNAIKLTFTFSGQFVLGMSLVVFMCYTFWPWYNKQDVYTKVVAATLSPLVTFFPKLICRLAAQKLKDVHPGSAHVFVTVIYGTFTIVYRVMQAELSTLTSFIVLGIAHGFVDLIERLTVTMRDYIWEYLYKLLRCKRKPKSKYRSPRSRRFVADMSIQILLQEGTGLVAGLGFIHLYHFMYSDTKPPYTDYTVVLNFLVRVFTGLAIDLVFNTISVVLQTRFMNIPIMKVWTLKWRHHCVVMTIVALETFLFFTIYLFDIVRNKYNYDTHPMVRYAWNCSMPFSQL